MRLSPLLAHLIRPDDFRRLTRAVEKHPLIVWAGIIASLFGIFQGLTYCGVFTSSSSDSGENTKVEMSFEEFTQRHESLSDRFREHEEFISRSAGKEVEWVVSVEGVTSIRTSSIFGKGPVLMAFKSEKSTAPLPVLGFAVYGRSFRELLFSLQKGDLIKVEGVLSKDWIVNYPTIDGNSVELIRSRANIREPDSSAP